MINKFFARIIKSCLKIEKRVRFVISAFFLTMLMLFSTFFFFDKAWIFLPVFIFFTYILTFFSIIEGIEKIEWVTLFIMPIIFIISFYFFYFLFPVRWLTRLPLIIIFAVSMYALILVSNIFNVGVEKSLQLYRAAFSVNYFYHTLVIFLITNLVFSYKMNFISNGLIIFITGLILATHLFWSITLKLHLEKRTLFYGLLVAIVLTEEVILFSFIPFKTSILALILTASYYSLAGLTYSHLDNRLFKETVREYLFVLGFVLIIAVLTLSW